MQRHEAEIGGLFFTSPLQHMRRKNVSDTKKISSSVSPRLLRTKEAAAYLGISRTTFYMLRLPKVNIADGRYDVRDLDHYIEINKDQIRRFPSAASSVEREFSYITTARNASSSRQRSDEARGGSRVVGVTRIPRNQDREFLPPLGSHTFELVETDEENPPEQD